MIPAQVLNGAVNQGTSDEKQSRPTNPRANPVAVEALLIPAEIAGPMCGRSQASWWRDHAAGRIPAPIKLGGRTLWRVAELRNWVAAGCPKRKIWEAMKVT